LGIEDEWAAWQLDEVCLIVGRERENEDVQNPHPQPPSTGSGQRFPQSGGREHGQVYAPMAMPGIAKMKIPENGIW